MFSFYDFAPFVQAIGLFPMEIDYQFQCIKQILLQFFNGFALGNCLRYFLHLTYIPAVFTLFDYGCIIKFLHYFNFFKGNEFFFPG